MGSIHRLVPHDDLTAHARDTARKVAALVAPGSVRARKRPVYAGLSAPLASAGQLADRDRVASFGGADIEAGARAIVPERPPNFRAD